MNAKNKTKNTVAFRGTKEQKQKLLNVIEENKDKRGALIPVLHKAQEIYGYLPFEVQKVVAQGLDIPLEEVYGVVTFYTLFSLTPKGKYKIGLCLGTACYVKGSGDILDKIKQRLSIEVDECTPDKQFSLEATRCIGACGLAPVLTVNEDVYAQVSVDDIDGIIKKYQKEAVINV